jgi:hypothetical protein
MNSNAFRNLASSLERVHPHHAVMGQTSNKSQVGALPEYLHPTRVPADGGGVRGQAGRDTTIAAGDPLLYGRPLLPDVTIVADAGMSPQPTRRRSRTPGCRSSSAPASPICRTSWPSGGANSLGDPRTGTSSSSPGSPGRPTDAGTRLSTISTGPTWPDARCAGRRAGRQGREGRGRHDAGQTQSFRPAVRRHPDGEPGLEGQGAAG